MKKKRSFTLIEMMISFSLFAIIISSFFYWTHRHYLQQKSCDQARTQLLEERYFEQRITSLLSKATLTQRAEEEILQFQSDGKSLFFTFDNGVYSHPLLSNTIRCSLEKKKDILVCTLRPLSHKGNYPELTYPLLDKISTLSFSFYQPRSPKNFKVDPDEVNPNKPGPGEHHVWEREYSALPAYVKLTLQREGEVKEFLFDLNYPIFVAKEVS
jgi:type II secretory pathway pseudopilin PulG